MANPRTLILLRHAAAGNAPRDHDRPLTPDGNRDAAAAGDWIREHVPSVDAVLCSTAVRTRQTLAATRIQAPAIFADELYGGGIDDILGQIALLPESAHTVLVVGTRPGRFRRRLRVGHRRRRWLPMERSRAARPTVTRPTPSPELRSACGTSRPARWRC